jgi:hypothetical protein
MTTLSTVYQLLFKQNFAGQDILNVFFYDHTVGSGGSADLVGMFITDVAPLINALQAAVMQNVGVEAINLGVTSDFWASTLSGTGSISSDSLPPQDAINFTFRSADRAVRKGGKRISGVPESKQVDGGIIDSGYLTAIEALREQFKTDLTLSGNTFHPIIVKRIKTAVTGTVPLQYTYRLPRPGDDLTVANVLDVLTTNLVSSQVSRKR